MFKGQAGPGEGLHKGFQGCRALGGLGDNGLGLDPKVEPLGKEQQFWGWI